MTRFQRYLILLTAFLAMLFDGFELGLMPVASLSVTQSLLGEHFTSAKGGDWFARFTAALMLGAAIGGIAFGNLGDRIGRTRAMGICVLCYSLFAAMGGWVTSQEQMLVLRFLVGLGVGGLLPNAISLVSECWEDASRPFVSGMMMAGLNSGILLLSQLARLWPISADSWRWLFQLSGFPAILGIVAFFILKESPRWLSSQQKTKKSVPFLGELFRPPLLKITLIGILLSSIPMIGAWSASKWMIPWADQVATASDPSYKAMTQGWWALGAVIGSLAGAQLAYWIGRRLSYFLICIATLVSTWAMFQLTEPLQPSFHPIVFLQGLVSTLFFGWLSLFLPEIFPTRVRASGSGLAFNSGRFATSLGVLFAGFLFSALGGNYPRVGTICALIYLLGLFVIWFVPSRLDQGLHE